MGRKQANGSGGVFVAEIDLSAVDIRYVLSKLRPGITYGWSGRGDFGNRYTNITRWPVAAGRVPTESEIYNYWAENGYEEPEVTEKQRIDTVSEQIEGILQRLNSAGI